MLWDQIWVGSSTLSVNRCMTVYGSLQLSSLRPCIHKNRDHISFAIGKTYKDSAVSDVRDWFRNVETEVF